MNFLKDLLQAVVLAALIGGPLFYYLLVVWKP
jgi:ABC-type Fe3+-siderophore transport system permease subunit